MAQYRFPASIHVDEVPEIVTQACAVVSEAHEARLEAWKNDLGQLAIETWDTVHACETQLRKLEALGVDVDAAYAEVKRKNEARGYYPSGQE